MQTYFWPTGWAIIEQVRIKVMKMSIKGNDVSEFVAHFQMTLPKRIVENK